MSTVSTSTTAGDMALNKGVSGVTRRRIESIDVLRGLVMVIMALDHARDYFHGAAYIYDPLDLQQTTPFLFFTRWITHFCAPIFMFLAGVSAYLYGQKNGRKALSFFLLTRGLWLILLEMFIVTPGWLFNFHFTAYILQVIWAFGVSMIVLSALVYLNRTAILLIALVLIGGHNLLDDLDKVQVAGNSLSALFWAFLHVQKPFTYGSYLVFMGYPILPWIGLIAAGYYLGSQYGSGIAPATRKKNFARLGWLLLGLFLLIRLANIYGDPYRWSVQRSTVYTILSFFNVTKYPPSLLYCLLTIGPALLFLAYAEKPLNAVTGKLVIFGRVPMFYYLLHIYLFHALAVAGAVIAGHPASDMVSLTTWVTANTQLKGYGFSLWVVYGVWIVGVVALYPLCKWFAEYKRAHQAEKKWLSYL